MFKKVWIWPSLADRNPSKELPPSPPALDLRPRPGWLASSAVQRLYSMFPLGGPGIGLVLLRLSLAALLLLDIDAVSVTLPGRLVWPGIVIMTAALALGILTPIVSLLGFLVACIALAQWNPAAAATALLTMLNTASLFLLGPGAYSLDGRIYGRRILILPRDKG